MITNISIKMINAELDGTEETILLGNGELSRLNVLWLKININKHHLL